MNVMGALVDLHNENVAGIAFENCHGVIEGLSEWKVKWLSMTHHHSCSKHT